MITSYNFFTSIGVRLGQLFLRFKARTPHRGFFLPAIMLRVTYSRPDLRNVSLVEADIDQALLSSRGRRFARERRPIGTLRHQRTANLLFFPIPRLLSECITVFPKFATISRGWVRIKFVLSAQQTAHSTQLCNCRVAT
jgi:hypothetical protein